MNQFGNHIQNGSPDSLKYKKKSNLAKNVKGQIKHHLTHSKFIPQSPVKGQSYKDLSKIN
jgi:hypothetical protein